MWNRTPAKAESLRDSGAQAFSDPAEAVRGATRVHLTLSDDAAVDDVLSRAASGFAADVTVFDHTTTSTAGAHRRVDAWAAKGVTYVHAPVFMGPQNALEGTGLMLVSGDRDVVARVTPVLATMTGKVVDLGPKVDAAAAFKLLGNCFLMFLTAGLADMLMLAKAVDVAPEDALSLFQHFNPGATIGARAKRMLDVDAAPSWELSMARKDARLILEEVARKELSLAAVPAIAARMDSLIAEGLGAEDWTVMARSALK